MYYFGIGPASYVSYSDWTAIYNFDLKSAKSKDKIYD